MAKKTVGNLVATLTLRSSKFEKGLKRSSKATQTFATRLRSVTTKIVKFGAAMAAAAFAGISLLVRQQLKLIDVLAKTASKLGVSVVALQALRLAAQLAGVEIRTFDMGLQRMIRRISEAAMGMGEAQDAIKELGLDAAELVGLPVEEAFKRIADAMLKVTNQSDRVRLAFKLFDSEGVALINMLKGGREALEAIERDAKELGLTMDNIDAAQVEAANDAWTRFKAAASAAAQVLTVQLAPFIEAAINALIKWGKSGTGAGDKIAAGLEFVAKVIAFVGNIIQALGVAWKGLQVVAAGAVAIVINVVNALGIALTALLNLLPGVELEWSSTMQDLAEGAAIAAEDALESFTTAFDKLASDPWGDKVTDTLDKIREDARKAAEEAANAADAFNDLGDGIAEAATEMDRLADLTRLADRIIEQTRTPLEKFTKQMELLADLLSKGLIDQDTFERAVRQAEELLAKAQGITKEAEAEVEADEPGGDVRQVRLREIAIGGIRGTDTAQRREQQALDDIDQGIKDLKEEMKKPKPIKWVR